jgi:Cu/Ag efflux pump CusA
MPTLKEGTLQLQATLNPNASLETSIAMGTEIEAGSWRCQGWRGSSRASAGGRPEATATS